jgi:membrane associated rhomboid family serine protease
MQRGRATMSLGPPVGPVTKVLCGALLVASIVFALTQRKLGFGIGELIFTVPDVLNLQVWRLFTYPLIEAEPFSLMMSVLLLYLFGRTFEYRWGSQSYLRFFILSCVGAALLAIPLSLGIDLLLPFNDTGVVAGPDPAIDAMLVALAVANPDSNILFGFVLPIRARTVVYIVLGLQIVTGLMAGVASLAITLGGMIMGYFLSTGMWRPERFMARMKLWRLRKKRRGLYVVPPRTDHTLH